MNEIKNEMLKVVINPKGAELWSIKDENGIEYLWQGDKNVWEDRSPNLFPYIARLTEGSYTLNGVRYQMEMHGFVANSTLVPEDIGVDKITFVLEQNANTRKQYPYDFKFKVIYALVENTLNITFTVENKSGENMYFAVGGHPGFNVPLNENDHFEDYYLEFVEPCKPKRIGFTDDCYINGEKEDYTLVDDKIINLKHDLFNKDAIVLENTSKTVVLKSEKSDKRVTVHFPDCDYLGVWHMPFMEAPYVCIEPWTSLPSRKGIVEEISKQKNLITLAPKDIYENNWTITIN